MTIYVDDGKTVKTYYHVKAKVAKAVMTLLESDDELVWSKTHEGYGVTIIDKEKREERYDTKRRNRKRVDICRYDIECN